MEDIRFVLEAPQNHRAHKKRPRLVTSCDNCRMKKIKCIQSAPNTVCEACSSARTSCRFRDRERYFAERSRMVSAAAASSKKSTSEKSSPEIMISTDLTASPPTATFYKDPMHIQGGVTRSGPKRGTTFHPYLGPNNVPPRVAIQPDVYTPSAPSSLFDPKQPDRPRSTLMMTFIQLFFDNLNIYFPFLAYDETIRRFLGQELTALQANLIAALSVRYADLPEVAEQGGMFVTDQFCDNAKTLAAAAVSQGPDLDTLHSLILLAWVEYNRNRVTEFCHYGRMAVSMAMALGLQDEKTLEVAPSEYERSILQATWSSINFLESAVQSCLNIRM